MNKKRTLLITALLLTVSISWLSSPFAFAAEADAPVAGRERGAYGKPVDRSGKTQRGKASYYGKQFHGKKMADGTPMNPDANIAASKTLPLGTKAKVTNLENGKSETVEIRDRGPYIEGRIVDVSPKVAEKLEMKEQGVARVEVTPLELPQQPPQRQAKATARGRADTSAGASGTAGSTAAGD